jgi:pimeloyl-ACP methyl ester carboxylesterase
MKVILCLVMLTYSALSLAVGAITPSRYFNINGVQIAAYESKGTKGPGILLIHGNTSSAQAFAPIFESAFARQYRVTAIDLQGYGNSGNAATYDVASFVNTITTSASLLGVDDGVIVGWSLGGDFALQAAPYLPNAQGFFLFGTAPVGVAPELPAPFLTPEESYAGEAVFYGFNPALTNAQVAAYVTAFFRPNYNVPQLLINEGLRTDPATRLAVFMAATGQDPTFLDEIQVIRNLTVPVALMMGNKEAFVRKAFLEGLAPSIPMLWDGEVKIVHNAGHAVQWEKPAVFIARLRQFIKDLNK